MSAANQPRIKPGVPTGGQWAAFEHNEAGVSLSDAPRKPAWSDIQARVDELAKSGHAPARATSATSDPRRAAGAKSWWANHFVNAEYGAAGGDYPQMPDDYTPKRTGGNALSGHRRTHRMAYSTADGKFSVRMPSATSIKAFEGETSGTFDVPVSAVDAGGNTVAGWVRATRSGANWNVTALGDFGEKTGAQVSEAVSAVLESRRPSRSLRDVGDLLEAHRARKAAGGDTFVEVPSTFISGVGYSDENGTMAVAIRDKLYGYQVSRDAFEAVRNSSSPGGAYNRLVKGQARSELGRCEECGRFYAAANPHTCPTGHKPPTGLTIEHNLAARASVASMARLAMPPTPTAVDDGLDDETRTAIAALASYKVGDKDTEVTADEARDILESLSPGDWSTRVYGIGVFPSNPTPQIVRIHSVAKLDSDAYRSRIAKMWVSGTTINDLVQPARPAPPPQPPFGTHTAVPKDAKTVDVRAYMIDAGKEPLIDVGWKPEGYRRGWTTDRAVADSVGKYTSSHYLPLTYKNSSGYGQHWNGESGILLYSGIGGEDAGGLAEAIPAGLKGERQADGPAAAAVLQAAAASDGRLEVGGYLVGPDRTDERVSTDSVYLYDATGSSPEYALHTLRTKYGVDAGTPTEVKKVENPWRPGEKCWYMFWD